MGGQAGLDSHADIRRATVSEGYNPELSGTANGVSCTVSQRSIRPESGRMGGRAGLDS
ncbi:MAG TPA: hypothetical protein H9713_06840 [Candidatus Mediterraneibacter surreyensis]|nr:hypothetical protein [Candidatus Mediterraneibacter surreyensis]